MLKESSQGCSHFLFDWYDFRRAVDVNTYFYKWTIKLLITHRATHQIKYKLYQYICEQLLCCQLFVNYCKGHANTVSQAENGRSNADISSDALVSLNSQIKCRGPDRKLLPADDGFINQPWHISASLLLFLIGKYESNSLTSRSISSFHFAQYVRAHHCTHLRTTGLP